MAGAESFRFNSNSLIAFTRDIDLRSNLPKFTRYSSHKANNNFLYYSKALELE
jgi:hypothetical protein